MVVEGIIANQVGLAYSLKNVYSSQQNFVKSTLLSLIEKISFTSVLLRDVVLQVFNEIRKHLEESMKLRNHVIEINDSRLQFLELEIKGQLDVILKRMDKENEVRQDMELQIAALKEVFFTSNKTINNTIDNRYKKTKEFMDSMDTRLNLLVYATVDDAKKGEVLTLNKVFGEGKKRKALGDLPQPSEQTQ